MSLVRAGCSRPVLSSPNVLIPAYPHLAMNTTSLTSFYLTLKSVEEATDPPVYHAVRRPEVVLVEGARRLSLHVAVHSVSRPLVRPPTTDSPSHSHSLLQPLSSFIHPFVSVFFGFRRQYALLPVSVIV